MKRKSKIVTFYSYKGGVGRTMALANVAFLAALNKRRVLVMDWDMEAPGLAYYFRGLHDASEAKKLKTARGLLDMCWDWSAMASGAQTHGEVEELFDKAESGELFQECICPLVSEDLFDFPLVLDYIGAGSLHIGQEKRQYEDALSKFSWVNFFDEHAGGALLEYLKIWSKKNYDLILIDSRTGFADVAGVCTMQLPDEVALCFVLNRQNIDGIARVASSIRETRKEQVTLRAVPMRVVRGESSEGSDAKARAVNELTRVGGFSQAAIQDDIKNLSVLAYDEVPFYETLAPFAAADPLFDPLTLNYARLASRIAEMDLAVPDFDKATVELVKSRLLPKQATVEFLQSLSKGEPERAVTELSQLLESAYDTVINGGDLVPEYAVALVDASSSVADLAGEAFEAIAIRTSALDLLRALTTLDFDSWQALLLDKLVEAVELNSYLSEWDTQLALLEEIDILLAASASNNIKIRRLDFRRKAAWIYLERKDLDSAMRTVDEVRALRKGISEQKLAKDQIEELLSNDIEIHRIKADVSLAKEDYVAAYYDLSSGLKMAEVDGKPRSPMISRHAFSIHMTMTTIPSPYISGKEAADHALAAVLNGSSIQRVVMKFNQLVDAIVRGMHNDFLVLIFCEALLSNDPRVKFYFSNYYGRYPALAIEFFRALVSLLSVVARAEDRKRALVVCEFFSDTASMVIKSLIRRKRTVSDTVQNQLDFEFDSLTTLLDSVGVHIERHSSELESRFFLGSQYSTGLQDEDR